MRKIISIGLLLLLTGCSAANKPVISEKSAPDSINSYDSGDVNGRINAIRNGATPKVKPTGKSESQSQTGQSNPADGQVMGNKQVQLEDLASQFSQATIKTNMGDFKVKFYVEDSPVTVNVFMNLAKKEFYNGTRFHRVIKDFMIQGGDPNSKDGDPANDGRGGPGFQFQDEFNSHKLVKGSLAMANSGPNTNGSQFFVVTAEATPHLDGKHTNFGEVVSGLEVVEKIGNSETDGTDHPVSEVIVEKIILE